MAASEETVQIVVVSSICLLLIGLRCAYRLTYRCTIHQRCHRKWHVDDLWMALSIVPLLGRSLSTGWAFILKLRGADESLSVGEREKAMVIALKLLISARIFYMFFLWCMKMCLLELYLRLCEGLPFYRRIGVAIRWSLYATFVAVVLATLLECRPLQLAWNGDPAGDVCRKAKINLVTMGSLNIVTDVALILFPITLLRRSGLDLNKFLRLAFLFALGSLIIVTTIIRLPLIIQTNIQKTRSLWASIEICCACFVANAPFFQAAIHDIKGKGSHHNKEGSRNSVSAGEDRVTRARTVSLAKEDEIGLWHIERSVDFSVEGGRRPGDGSMGDEESVFGAVPVKGSGSTL